MKREVRFADDQPPEPIFYIHSHHLETKLGIQWRPIDDTREQRRFRGFVSAIIFLFVLIVILFLVPFHPQAAAQQPPAPLDLQPNLKTFEEQSLKKFLKKMGEGNAVELHESLRLFSNLTEERRGRRDLQNVSEAVIVPRSGWQARPPLRDPPDLALPVEYVIVMHTGTENCLNESTCINYVRLIQNMHTANWKWWDIAYNFLVGGDGLVYEGRGWHKEGAHSYSYNEESLGVAFIGSFNRVLPPQRQIRAAQKLIEKGVRMGYIAPDYKLVGAKQLQATESPGLLLFNDLKTWDHWSETL